MASSMSCVFLASWTLAAIALQILGLSLFAIGFFPVKPSLPGISGPESYRVPGCDAEVNAEEVDLPPDQLKSLYRDLSKIPPTFDRLVLMIVVDGLPAEFILGRGDSRPSKAMMEAMPYTQSLLLKREAIAYHAKAAPPTVTMPRLKAMVSGAIGGFLDVAFNFNTQAFLDDNLLDQLYRIGWKLVMLGDNTWIKLFPGLFLRQDGVSSFFVKDTVEVDYNVTRHLEAELAANDWSLLILHYLGLDHVGHIGGRQSKLMAPKLNEMDEVIKTIHTRQAQDQDNVDKRTLLVVASDHGMTDSGNHGGSTYEETDSLALFIGIGSGYPLYAPNEHNEVFQVDITPTLALLFGVPIPKNNIGVLLLEIFNTLTDEQKLRVLELNSWHLLRLLRAHIRDLCCGDFVCGTNDGIDLGINGSFENDKEKFTHLFSRAIDAHNKWKVLQDSRFSNTDNVKVAVASYYDFLGNASEWLSHRATDKPIKLLVSGICVMLISCIVLISLSICFIKKIYFTPKQSYYLLKKHVGSRYLHEAFVCLGIFTHVVSLGASSMVEEEQYTWHYLTCSLYLIFLFTTVQFLIRGQTSDSNDRVKGEEQYIFHQSQKSDARDITWLMDLKSYQRKDIHNFNRISSIIIVLICGRVLRGWHQGGVNWVHLPDISKWLEQSGAFTVKYLQITALLLILVVSSFALFLARSRRRLVFVIFYSYLACGFLVFLYAIKNQGHNVVAMDHSATSIAQALYGAVAIIVILIPLVSPWMVPVHYQERKWMSKLNSNSKSLDVRINFPLFDGIWESTYLIGVTYCVCWCLLQLVLQHQINAIPIFLLFLQLLASMIYFSTDESDHREWIKVAAIYFLGMSGHFALGNSNSLATVDVAGAFIGISSHSTILSGILMFIITHASSILSFLSLIMSSFVKDIGYLSSQRMSELGCIFQMIIALPCLIPLTLNSIVLTTSTIILLFMRNHLFIWSVFSPKYLYVCAATLSVYIGICMIAITCVYTCAVVFYRTKTLQ